MRGKKSYNIRNIEAHLNTFKQPYQHNQVSFSNLIGRDLIFQTNSNSSALASTNIIKIPEQLKQNEYINAKFGVSKYASNLVSGKMFKHI